MISDQLLMGTNGAITNSGGDYLLDDDGLTVSDNFTITNDAGDFILDQSGITLKATDSSRAARSITFGTDGIEYGHLFGGTSAVVLGSDRPGVKLDLSAGEASLTATSGAATLFAEGRVELNPGPNEPVRMDLNSVHLDFLEASDSGVSASGYIGLEINGAQRFIRLFNSP